MLRTASRPRSPDLLAKSILLISRLGSKFSGNSSLILLDRQLWVPNAKHIVVGQSNGVACSHRIHERNIGWPDLVMADDWYPVVPHDDLDLIHVLTVSVPELTLSSFKIHLRSRLYGMFQLIRNENMMINFARLIRNIKLWKSTGARSRADVTVAHPFSYSSHALWRRSPCIRREHRKTSRCASWE